jgi:hypothetical protein
MTKLNGLVPKGWGSEFIFATNDKYCGKFLNFETGAKFSMHFHAVKDETWYVQSGKFIVQYIDTTPPPSLFPAISSGNRNVYKWAMKVIKKVITKEQDKLFRSASNAKDPDLTAVVSSCAELERNIILWVLEKEGVKKDTSIKIDSNETKWRNNNNRKRRGGKKRTSRI